MNNFLRLGLLNTNWLPKAFLNIFVHELLKDSIIYRLKHFFTVDQRIDWSLQLASSNHLLFLQLSSLFALLQRRYEAFVMLIALLNWRLTKDKLRWNSIMTSPIKREGLYCNFCRLVTYRFHNFGLGAANKLCNSYRG